MRALVVDPGKMTGFGFLEWEPSELGMGSTFDGWERDHFGFLEWAEPVIAMVDLVVCEGYKVSQRTMKEDPSSVDGLWSIKQIGCLELWCHQAGVRFVQQMPGDKAFADNDKLKAIGWWQATEKGEKGHRRDAARHAVTWGVRNNVIDPRRLLNAG